MAIQLRIITSADSLPHGRGFYQLEEEVLYFPLEYKSPDQHFFSFLESENLSLQFNKSGQLIFVELKQSRRKWIHTEDLKIPIKIEPADIRFLDFRQKIPDPKIYCDKSRENIFIKFQAETNPEYYCLTENLIIQSDAQKELTALWILNIIDDLAGKEIAAWRKKVRGDDSGYRSSRK